MSEAAKFVFYLLAALSFFAALIAERVPQPQPHQNVWYSRTFFIALGLLFYVLVPLIETAKAL